MQSLRLVQGHVEIPWRPMSAGWTPSRRLPPASPGSNGLSPCKLDVRSRSSSIRVRWTICTRPDSHVRSRWRWVSRSPCQDAPGSPSSAPSKPWRRWGNPEPPALVETWWFGMPSRAAAQAIPQVRVTSSPGSRRMASPWVGPSLKASGPHVIGSTARLRRSSGV